ncbi:uncharacterized protein [Apostichopus japonicus]|uniref:uncharacterized protein n=1 Tax=Stichopus japonicus TaxID=307972 RepID=UPI003AB1DDCB
MENDAPTAAGPTPDSEENNNANEKESPGPSTVESTSKEATGEENEGRSETQPATPKSDEGDVTTENAGDVTVGSKLPEDEEDNVMEKPKVETETTGNNTEKNGEDYEDNVPGEGRQEGERKEDPAKAEEPKETNQTTDESKEEDSQPDPAPENEGETASPENVVDGTGEMTDETSREQDQQKEHKDHVTEVKGGDAGVVESDGTGAKSEEVSNNEGNTDKEQESENPDSHDTSSSVSKIDDASKVEDGSKQDDGYSADNEATTLASADTGLVLEQDDSTKDERVEPPQGKADSFGEVKVETEEEETHLSHEDLLTKYHAAEIQLDGLQEENTTLKEKVESLEKEIHQLREGTEHEKVKQRDGYRVQADFLARELSQTQDAEKFLKEKVAELLEEKEEGEKKVRDLQLRLKRFAKDDKGKDERISKLETELKEITEVIQELESYVDEETRLKIQEKRTSTRQSTVSGQENSHTKVTDMNKMNTNRSYRDPEPVQRSRTCIIV